MHRLEIKGDVNDGSCQRFMRGLPQCFREAVLNSQILGLA